MIAINQSRRKPRRFILSKVGECLYRSEAGSYFAVIKHRGKQHRQSLQTKDRGIASKKLVEFRQKLNRQAPDKKHVADMTFDQLGSRWLDLIQVHLKPTTHYRRYGLVKMLNKWFGGRPARRITQFDCEQWATTRNRQVSARTFNSEVETLKLVFNYAIQHGLLLDNPASPLKRRKLDTKPVVIPSRQEFITLVNDMRSRTARAADWIEFLSYSGCRTGEASEVCWADVDFVRKTVLISGGEKGTKNGETRNIPLFPALERLVNNIKASLPRPPRPSDRILRGINARWALETVCKRLGVFQYHRHSFRHFFASNAIEAGVDFKTIAGWLGHKDGGVLVAQIYGHLRAEHSELMAKRMTFDAVNQIGPYNTAKG